MAVGIVGTLGYGILASDPQKYHWAAVLVMAGFQFFTSLAAFIASTTYAIECFPDLAAPIIITVGAYRNIIGFGLVYGSTAFVEHAGYKGCFGGYAGIMGLLSVFGVFFYIFGERLRKMMNTWPFRYSQASDE